jgi:dUTP pyrophosphatase
LHPTTDGPTFEHWANGVVYNWGRAMERAVLVKRLDPRAKIPQPGKPGDVGFDLPVLDGGKVAPGGYRTFHSGLAIAMPSGIWAAIEGRSSTWRERNLITLRSIIDNGYTGELLSGVFNPTQVEIEVESGARLKQVIFYPMIVPPWQEVDELPHTARGATGFGSTGR